MNNSNPTQTISHHWPRSDTASPPPVSRREARLLAVLQDTPVFDPTETARRLGLSRSTAHQLLHRAAAKGLVRRITRGRYTLGAETLVAATNLVAPSYLSFWSALSLHGLSLQVPHTLQLTTTKPRRRLFLNGTPIQFVTLGSRRCFGYRHQPDGACVASPEKAMVDALYLPRLAGGLGEVRSSLERGLREGLLDPRELARLALRMDSASLCRRLGYLLAQAPSQLPSRLQGALEASGRGYALLDPGRPRCGPRDKRWRLQLNLEVAR